MHPLSGLKSPIYVQILLHIICKHFSSQTLYILFKNALFASVSCSLFHRLKNGEWCV